MRAHKLLKQIKILAKEGIIKEQPSLEDYHTVLQCWKYSSFSSQQPTTMSITTHVQELLEEISQPTTRTYELACSILDADHGLELLFDKNNTTIANRIEPTLNMYNSVLSAFARAGAAAASSSSSTTTKDRPQKAAELLNYMKTTNNAKPDGTSYNTVIECWTKSNLNGAVDEAENLLNQMKQEKIQRTCDSYTPIIEALAKVGEAKRAEDLLVSLIQDYGVQFDADLKPGIEPFQSVLWAYSKSYHTNAAQRATSFLSHFNELYLSLIHI